MNDVGSAKYGGVAMAASVGLDVVESFLIVAEELNFRRSAERGFSRSSDRQMDRYTETRSAKRNYIPSFHTVCLDLGGSRPVPFPPPKTTGC